MHFGALDPQGRIVPKLVLQELSDGVDGLLLLHGAGSLFLGRAPADISGRPSRAWILFRTPISIEIWP